MTRLPLESPLEYDNTKMDIEVIDRETGKPIGRPWITIGYGGVLNA